MTFLDNNLMDQYEKAAPIILVKLQYLIYWANEKCAETYVSL